MPGRLKESCWLQRDWGLGNAGDPGVPHCAVRTVPRNFRCYKARVKLLSHLPLRHQGFWLAQLLGLLLLLLSFVIIAGNLQSSEFGGQVLDAVFSGPIWGTRLARNLAWFALSLGLLHGLFAAGCWVVGRLSAQAWPGVKATVRQHVLLWFLALTVGLLANN